MKKLFSFFWDRSLLIFLCIGLGNTIITQVGSQLLLGPVSRLWGPAAGYWVPTAFFFAVTGIVSFILNRRFSFKSKAPLGRSIFRFAVITTGCYLLSFGLSQIIVPAFMAAVFPDVDGGWIPRIAILFAQVIFTLLNYLGQRLWAFKE